MKCKSPAHGSRCEFSFLPESFALVPPAGRNASPQLRAQPSPLTLFVMTTVIRLCFLEVVVPEIVREE